MADIISLMPPPCHAFHAAAAITLLFADIAATHLMPPLIGYRRIIYFHYAMLLSPPLRLRHYYYFISCRFDVSLIIIIAATLF